MAGVVDIVDGVLAPMQLGAVTTGVVGVDGGTRRVEVVGDFGDLMAAVIAKGLVGDPGIIGARAASFAEPVGGGIVGVGGRSVGVGDIGEPIELIVFVCGHFGDIALSDGLFDAIAVAVTCEPTLPIYVSEEVLDAVQD